MAKLRKSKYRNWPCHNGKGELTMQIDFHHGVTYLCARLAGFSAAESNIIAYSAQYVDDATHTGSIRFDNEMMYDRISSAHKMLDYRNMSELANHKAWLPFHFLPGNEGKPASNEIPVHTQDSYLRHCICRPNSYVAKEMMADVIRRKSRPYALHRLGIAAHVYQDTWAHQGFVGFQHLINRANDVKADNDEHHRQTFSERLEANFAGTQDTQNQSCWDKIKGFFKERQEAFATDFLSTVLPLGHGAVLSYPDRPYLSWSYLGWEWNETSQRYEEITKKRNNPKIFYEATCELYQMFRRFRDYSQSEANSDVDPLAKTYPLPPQMSVFCEMISSIKNEDSDERHQRWLELLADGTFGFRDQVRYVAEGPGSWKFAALGREIPEGKEKDESYPYVPNFLNSDWKLFHDALSVHRLHILNELLPRFGLVSA